MRNGVGRVKRALAFLMLVAVTAGVGAVAMPGTGSAQLLPPLTSSSTTTSTTLPLFGSPPGFGVPFPAANFSGYSTGTFLHTDALATSLTGPSLADVDQGFSGASVASQGTNSVRQGAPLSETGRIVNEMGVEVQPRLPANSPKLQGDRSYARGAGLELGLLQNATTATPQVPLNTARASAPPPNEDVQQVTLNAGPVAFASLLKGTARADWNNDRCILGKPISEGIGQAADVQLLNTGGGTTTTTTPGATTSSTLPGGGLLGGLLNPLLGTGSGIPTDPTGLLGGLTGTVGGITSPLLATSASNPERGSAFSRSITQLVAPTTHATGVPVVVPNPSGAGLLSETRQTLAPITLFKGTLQEITIEVLGEFVLQAVAGGTPGTSYVRFAPGSQPSPNVPALRILQPFNTDPTQRVRDILRLDQLFGADGGLLALPDIPLVPGLVNISIGERPRAIGSDGAANPPGPEVAADGTSASGAVDVVRIQILANDTLGLVSGTEIRIGHMEARAQVPQGGVECRAGIFKDSDPRVVDAGDHFTYNIDINNPFDCTLTNVRVIDRITGTPGVRHTVLSTNPTAAILDPPAGVVSPDRTVNFGDIGAIAARTTRRLNIQVEASPGSTDGFFTDEVTREASCEGIPLRSESFRIDLPRVGGRFLPPPPPPLLPPLFPPPLLPPPVLPPLLAPPPAVLRTDLVRPVLPFTGSSSVALAGSAAFLLAFGAWLLTSSGRVATAGGPMALLANRFGGSFGGRFGGRPSSGGAKADPTLFQGPAPKRSGATSPSGHPTTRAARRPERVEEAPVRREPRKPRPPERPPSDLSSLFARSRFDMSTAADLDNALPPPPPITVKAPSFGPQNRSTGSITGRSALPGLPAGSPPATPPSPPALPPVAGPSALPPAPAVSQAPAAAVPPAPAPAVPPAPVPATPAVRPAPTGIVHQPVDFSLDVPFSWRSPAGADPAPVVEGAAPAEHDVEELQLRVSFEWPATRRQEPPASDD